MQLEFQQRAEKNDVECTSQIATERKRRLDQLVPPTEYVLYMALDAIKFWPHAVATLLINDCGHLARFTQTSSEREKISKYFRVDPGPLQQFIDEQSAEHIQADKEKVATALSELQQLKTEVEQHKEWYLRSVVCIRTVNAGLVRSIDYLEKLLEKTEQYAKPKRVCSVDRRHDERSPRLFVFCQRLHFFW